MTYTGIDRSRVKAGKMNEKIATYEEFFLFYLREHSRPATRALHYLAAAAAPATLACGLLAGPWWIALLAPLAGYGPAWISHAFIERNVPATFTYPRWSLISDYRMTWLWLTGRLAPCLAQAGVGTAASLPTTR